MLSENRHQAARRLCHKYRIRAGDRSPHRHSLSSWATAGIDQCDCAPRHDPPQHVDAISRIRVGVKWETGRDHSPKVRSVDNFPSQVSHSGCRFGWSGWLAGQDRFGVRFSERRVGGMGCDRPGSNGPDCSDLHWPLAPVAQGIERRFPKP